MWRADLALLLALAGACQDEMELDMPVEVISGDGCTVVLLEEIKTRGKGAHPVPAAGARHASRLLAAVHASSPCQAAMQPLLTPTLLPASCTVQAWAPALRSCAAPWQ